MRRLLKKVKPLQNSQLRGLLQQLKMRPLMPQLQQQHNCATKFVRR